MIKITSAKVRSDPLIKEPSYVALTLLAFITTLLLLAYHLWQTHEQAIGTAVINTKNLAWVLEDRLDTTFRRVDADLAQIATKATSAKSSQKPELLDHAVWSGYLAGFKTNFPEVNGYYIFDSTGKEVTSSEHNAPFINIADRDHFQRLRDTPDAKLVFSDVIMSRTINRPTMVVARGMHDQDGRFIGIVSATVDLDYLEKLFNSIQIGEQGAIGLVRTDSQKLVFRYPSHFYDYNKEIISKQGQRIAAGEKVGVERYTSPVDNIIRIGSFRTLTNYPFFVIVAIAETDALVQWRSIAIRSIGGTTVFLAILFFLQIQLLRAEKLRRKAIQELDRIAKTDELTDLPNRHHFMIRAEEELSRALRYGGHMSILMMDIDNFKAINDTYGHQIGDTVLKELAELCRQSLRIYDIVGRIGGEEFAFVLPNTEIALGIEIAERMRENIENATVKIEDGRDIKFTVSIGVAALTNDKSSIDSLLIQSDKAMYKAKRSGRNRVCIYGAEKP